MPDWATPMCSNSILFHALFVPLPKCIGTGRKRREQKKRNNPDKYFAEQLAKKQRKAADALIDLGDGVRDAIPSPVSLASASEP